MHMLILKQICNTTCTRYYMTVLYDMFLNEMNVFEYVLHREKLWVDGHNLFLMKIMLPYNPVVCIVVVLDQVGWRVRSPQLDPPNIHYLIHNLHERSSTLHMIILKQICI